MTRYKPRHSTGVTKCKHRQVTQTKVKGVHTVQTSSQYRCDKVQAQTGDTDKS